MLLIDDSIVSEVDEGEKKEGVKSRGKRIILLTFCLPFDFCLFFLFILLYNCLSSFLFFRLPIDATAASAAFVALSKREFKCEFAYFNKKEKGAARERESESEGEQKV